MNKNYKKVIIILIIIFSILLILSGIILILIKLTEIPEEELIQGDPPIEYPEEYIESIEKDVKKVSAEDEYFYLENILNTLYLYLRMSNSKIAYNILDVDYIKENRITQENLLDILKEKIDFNNDYVIKEAYTRDSFYKPIFYCYGEETNKDNAIKNVYFRVNEDNNNATYSVSLITKEEYENFISEKVKEKNDKEIPANNNNKWKIRHLSEEDVASKYFEDFIYKEATDVNLAYNLLNKEYREKRFKAISSYQEYLNLNKDKINSLNVKGIKDYEEFNSDEEYEEYMNNLTTKGISKYKYIRNENDEKTIICVDDYGYNYIFYITSAMEYTVILDIHTVALPELITDYSSLSEQNKIKMNMEKVRDAINSYDYEYLYSKLDNTFKKNNYPTLSSLKEFLRENLYDINKFTYSNMEEQNGVYTTEVKVTDTTGINANEKHLNIIMKLTGENDFVMSFNNN